MANTAPTPKAVAIVLFPALVLMLAFAFSYVGAFHDPTLHHVPVAVVGPPAVSGGLNQLPGDPLDARQSPSRADALSQIDDRKVYGAYDASTNRLFVASAANRATAIALETVFNRVAAAQNRPAVRVTDVKPLPPKDPNGTAAFYAVIAWVFGGYIGATLIGLIGTPRSRSRKRAAARIGALAGFGLVVGACYAVYRGVTSAFLRDLDLRDASPEQTRWAIRLGRIGWAALGLVYGFPGVLLIVAATTYSPGTPTSLDSGLRTVAGEPYGPSLIIALALGLAAFGVYCFFDARYRKA